MSEIPEGATHKQDVFFYKKECTCWYVYMSGWKPNTVANELRGWAESNLTLIKQDKEMNIDWNSKEAEGFNFILAHEDTSVRNEYCKEEPRGNPNSYHANGVTFHKPKWTLHTRPKAK